MVVVVAAAIVLAALVWVLLAPLDDTVARRATAVEALRQAVERAAVYEPPGSPEPSAGEEHHNVHVIRHLTRRGDDGMAPAA